MRKFLSALCLTCMMSVLSTSAVEASFTQIDNYSVVFDDYNNLYWIQTAPLFNGTYLDSLVAVEIFNTNDELHRISGDTVLWKSWRIADQSDMTMLWSYQAEEIATAFRGNASSPYYIFGRYDESPSPDRHYIAGVLINDDGDLTLSVLSEMSSDDDASNEWLGSWMVADAAPVPLPASALFFSLGLAGLAGIRLNGRNK